MVGKVSLSTHSPGRLPPPGGGGGGGAGGGGGGEGGGRVLQPRTTNAHDFILDLFFISSLY